MKKIILKINRNLKYKPFGTKIKEQILTREMFFQYMASPGKPVGG